LYCVAAAAAVGGIPSGVVSGAPTPGGPSGRGCVLLVSNLSEQTTPDVLFTIFGVYGDVQRVKIFYNKRDTALIQFSDPHQAYLAHLHLNHVEVFGKAMSITPSKHAQVALRHPTPDQPPQTGMLLTRDYSNSPLHRFKNVRSNNYRHICPPGPVLHVSLVVLLRCPYHNFTCYLFSSALCLVIQFT
jgi:hnRNP-L/PTB/hephaestus splicing factor